MYGISNVFPHPSFPLHMIDAVVFMKKLIYMYIYIIYVCQLVLPILLLSSLVEHLVSTKSIHSPALSTCPTLTQHHPLHLGMPHSTRLQLASKYVSNMIGSENMRCRLIQFEVDKRTQNYRERNLNRLLYPSQAKAQRLYMWFTLLVTHFIRSSHQCYISEKR